MRLRRLLAACAVLGLLAACSGGDDDPPPPSATLGTEPPRTTTTDPYAIPAVIDAAYVNRVLAGLDQVEGDAVRLLLRDRAVTQEILDHLKSIYATKERLQLEVDAFQIGLRNGLRNYHPSPGTRLTTVQRLLTANRTCIFAQVTRDYSRVGVNAGPPSTEWVGLRPLDRATDPAGYNKTSWAFVYDGFPRDQSQPPDPCAAP